MSKEEFLENIRRFEELEKKYEALSKELHKKMPEALSALVFKHLPKLLEDGTKKEEIISTITKKYTYEVWEAYNSVNSMQYTNKKVNTTPVPKPKTKEEEEEELKKELKDIPEKYHNDYTNIFWETIKEDNRHESFNTDVYNKMKEVFTEIYFDDVLALEPDYLRYFDSSIYYLVYEFLQDIYNDCNI